MAFHLEEQPSNQRQTIQDKVDELTYYLARYSIDGEFLGYQNLKSQLSVCPMTYTDVANMK